MPSRLSLGAGGLLQRRSGMVARRRLSRTSLLRVFRRFLSHLCVRLIPGEVGHPLRHLGQVRVMLAQFFHDLLPQFRRLRRAQHVHQQSCLRRIRALELAQGGCTVDEFQICRLGG